jgi:hypothetical protein
VHGRFVGHFPQAAETGFLLAAKRFDTPRRCNRRSATRLAWISHSNMQP